MTNTERTQFIVDKLWNGKWPNHDFGRTEGTSWICCRCLRVAYSSLTEPCEYFAPFTRLEDAFMVVEAVDRHVRLTWYPALQGDSLKPVWVVEVSKFNVGVGRSKSPAEAIALAAYRALGGTER